MKSKLPFISGACIAAIALCTPLVGFAQERNSPAPETSASASPGASAGKSERGVPYHGTVASVDMSAKTFTVGSRTFMVTERTKIMKQGAAATMQDIVADEQVRGQYWKKSDGTLEAKSVKLGAKSEDENSTRGGQKRDTQMASPSATP